MADYIPQLAHVNLNQFGIAVATPDGQVYAAGDASTLFSIQSISKVFTLTIGLGKLGDAIWTHVGREPSGDPFNSIMVLEKESGRPRNPFINAALAHFMKSFVNLKHNVDKVLGIYFHQCSIAMSCQQLAHAGLFLVSNGVNQHTGVRVYCCMVTRA